MAISDINIILILVGMWYWVIAITESDGPLDIFLWLRKTRFIGGLFSCYICLSIWVAGVMALLDLYLPPLLIISAIAGVFVMLYRVFMMVGDLINIVKTDHKLDTAHRIMAQIELHTTFSADVRNEIYREILDGNVESSLEAAINEWGYLTEDDNAE